MVNPFLDYDGQIEKLIRDKHLIIEDREYAREQLRQYGYFRLICSYKSPFKDPVTKWYRPGTRLEDIVALYKFDENLRELFLKYILKTECRLRSVISYVFAEKYGNAESAYLNPDHFTKEPKKKQEVRQLIRSLDRILRDNRNYAYVTAQQRRYDNVPLWVLINALSFGMLQTLYTLLEPELRDKVAAEFPDIDDRHLNLFLSVNTRFRNVCAHSERLFSYRSESEIPDLPFHETLRIPRENGRYRQGKNDLFAVLLSFRALLAPADFEKCCDHFRLILNHYLTQTAVIDQKEILQCMGFPENWEALRES